MTKTILLSCIACLILLSVTVSALAMPGSAAAGLTDSASEAIANGIERFFISAADKIFETSISGFVNTGGNNTTLSYIYNIASYTYDPFSTDIFDGAIQFSKTVFQEGFKLVLLFAFIMVLITHYRTDAAQKLNEMVGFNIAQKGNMMLKKSLDGILLAALMYVFIFFTLWFNDILTKAVMINMLGSITPTPSNFILYFMMALAYLFMMIFFGLRTLVIGLFFGFALIIGLCLLINPVKHTAETICAYFVQIVFFQFIIVCYFSLCILIIQSLKLVPQNEYFMYLIMMGGGVVLGIKMMFGTGVIRWAEKTVKLVV